MPLDTTFSSNIVNNVFTNIKQNYSSIKSLYGDTVKNIKYIQDTIRSKANDLFQLPELNFILLYNIEDKVDLNVVKDIIDKATHSPTKGKLELTFCVNKELDKLIKLYVISFCENVINLDSIKEELSIYKQLNKLAKPNINYCVKQYYFSVQKAILCGHVYTFSGIKFRLYIRGKYTSNNHNNGKPRLKVDWGESLKYLKEQAKKLDSKLYELYNSKYITKKEFIDRMSKYKIKWHIYITKTLNYWVRLDTSNSTLNLASLYSIVPSNFIGNESRSQIQFTTDNNSIDAVIEYENMGLRDKINSLQRVDSKYCKKTFEHAN